MRFETERFYLRNVRISDATKEYLNWLNASKDNIIRSSENKTLSDLKRFIKKVKSQKDINFKNHTISLGKRNVKLLKSSYVKKKIKTIFLAIIDKKNNQHVGNIKYDPIDIPNKFAIMGILIGSYNHVGKGTFKEVFLKTSKYIHYKYNITKIYLGLNNSNINAFKAYKKLGFKIHKRYRGKIYMSLNLPITIKN